MGLLLGTTTSNLATSCSTRIYIQKSKKQGIKLFFVDNDPDRTAVLPQKMLLVLAKYETRTTTKRIPPPWLRFYEGKGPALITSSDEKLLRYAYAAVAEQPSNSNPTTAIPKIISPRRIIRRRHLQLLYGRFGDADAAAAKKKWAPVRENGTLSAKLQCPHTATPPPGVAASKSRSEVLRVAKASRQCGIVAAKCLSFDEEPVDDAVDGGARRNGPCCSERASSVASTLRSQMMPWRDQYPHHFFCGHHSALLPSPL
jgi:hypothetical protein